MQHGRFLYSMLLSWRQNVHAAALRRGHILSSIFSHGKRQLIGVTDSFAEKLRDGSVEICGRLLLAQERSDTDRPVHTVSFCIHLVGNAAPSRRGALMNYWKNQEVGHHVVSTAKGIPFARNGT